MSCPLGTSPGLATRYPHPLSAMQIKVKKNSPRRRGGSCFTKTEPPRSPRLRGDPLVLGDDEVHQAFGDDDDLLDGLAVDPVADLRIEGGGGADLLFGGGGGDQHLAAQLAVDLDSDVDRLLGDELQ